MADSRSTALRTGVVGAAVFVGVLFITMFTGEVSSTVWNILAVLVIGSALVAIAGFARYFAGRHS